MVELFGVLTAVLLSCGSADQNCMPALEPPAVVALDKASATIVPKPVLKPQRAKVTATAAKKPAKRQVEMALDTDPVQKPAKRKRILVLIGAYY